MRLRSLLFRTCSWSPRGRAAVFAGWGMQGAVRRTYAEIGPAIGKRRNAADRPQRPLRSRVQGLERNRAIARPSCLHGHEPMRRIWVIRGPHTHPDCAPTRPLGDHEHVLTPTDSERKLNRGMASPADTPIVGLTDGVMLDKPHLTQALRTLSQNG